MSFLRNAKSFNVAHTTHKTAVKNFINNSHQINPNIRQNLLRAYRSIEGSEQLYGRRNAGLKDHFIERHGTHRIIGKDAMIRSRNAMRENENNPLLITKAMPPTKFTSKDVKIIQREAAKMTKTDNRIDPTLILPVAETSVSNFEDSTYRKRKTNKKDDTIRYSNIEEDVSIREMDKSAAIAKPKKKEFRKDVITKTDKRITNPAPIGKATRKDINFHEIMSKATAEMEAKRAIAPTGTTTKTKRRRRKK